MMHLLLCLFLALSAVEAQEEAEAPHPGDKFAMDVAGAFLGALFPDLVAQEEAPPPQEPARPVLANDPFASQGQLLSASPRFGSLTNPNVQQGLYNPGILGRTDLPASYVYPFAQTGEIIKPNNNAGDPYYLGPQGLFDVQQTLQALQREQEAQGFGAFPALGPIGGQPQALPPQVGQFLGQPQPGLTQAQAAQLQAQQLGAAQLQAQQLGAAQLQAQQLGAAHFQAQQLAAAQGFGQQPGLVQQQPSIVDLQTQAALNQLAAQQGLQSQAGVSELQAQEALNQLQQQAALAQLQSQQGLVQAGLPQANQQPPALSQLLGSQQQVQQSQSPFVQAQQPEIVQLPQLPPRNPQPANQQTAVDPNDVYLQQYLRNKYGTSFDVGPDLMGELPFEVNNQPVVQQTQSVAQSQAAPVETAHVVLPPRLPQANTSPELVYIESEKNLYKDDCPQCIPFDFGKFVGPWTQIYGNPQSLRTIYTTLLSLQNLKLSPGITTANLEPVQPSCVGLQVGRKKRGYNRSALNLFFRDDTNSRQLHEMTGILDRNATRDSNTLALRLPSLNLPMCLVRAGPKSSTLYGNMVLTETTGVNRCRSYHIFARTSGNFFRDHNAEMAKFLQNEVEAGRAMPVSVLPFPQMCEVIGARSRASASSRSSSREN